MKEQTQEKELMENLIKRLIRHIRIIEESGEDMDNASWNYQEGVLITGNEAKLFLELLLQNSER